MRLHPGTLSGICVVIQFQTRILYHIYSYNMILSLDESYGTAFVRQAEDDLRVAHSNLFLLDVVFVCLVTFLIIRTQYWGLSRG